MAAGLVSLAVVLWARVGEVAEEAMDMELKVALSPALWAVKDQGVEGLECTGRRRRQRLWMERLVGRVAGVGPSLASAAAPLRAVSSRHYLGRRGSWGRKGRQR